VCALSVVLAVDGGLGERLVLFVVFICLWVGIFGYAGVT